MAWKPAPGDVALVRNEYNVWNVAICAIRAGRRGFVWSYGVADSESPITAEARPLVVIDPEDDDAVERLLKAYHAKYPMDWPGDTDAIHARNLAAALREFADPKPPEVMEHNARPHGDDGVMLALCGKLWKPNPEARSAGRCPECEAIVTSGWMR